MCSVTPHAPHVFCKVKIVPSGCYTHVLNARRSHSVGNLYMCSWQALETTNTITGGLHQTHTHTHIYMYVGRHGYYLSYSDPYCTQIHRWHTTGSTSAVYPHMSRAAQQHSGMAVQKPSALPACTPRHAQKRSNQAALLAWKRRGGWCRRQVLGTRNSPKRRPWVNCDIIVSHFILSVSPLSLFLCFIARCLFSCSLLYLLSYHPPPSLQARDSTVTSLP